MNTGNVQGKGSNWRELPSIGISGFHAELRAQFGRIKLLKY